MRASSTREHRPQKELRRAIPAIIDHIILRHLATEIASSLGVLR
jgi:hypothetical protein